MDREEREALNLSKEELLAREAKGKPARLERQARLAARREILEAVNRWRGRERRLLGMRHVQEAACVARRRGLVSDASLAAAGYPVRRPHARRRSAAARMRDRLRASRRMRQARRRA